MKLRDSLYTIVSEFKGDGRHDFNIKLDPEHFIYKAHFPGEPITPGVCIMQIAKELLEEAEEDEMNGVKWKRSRLKSKLVEYRHHMFQNYAAGTVRKERTASSFFTSSSIFSIASSFVLK